jgi:hypothetical protein
MKRGKGFKPDRKRPIGFGRPAKGTASRTKRDENLQTLVAQAIGRLRSGGISLRQAAREFEIDPRTVVRRGGSALRRRKSGRYAATPTDRLLSLLKIVTPEGLRDVLVSSSRQRSRLGRYWSALQKHLQTGDSSALLKFEGKYIIDAHGSRIPFLTDLDQINRLASADVLRFESIYGRTR